MGSRGAALAPRSPGSQARLLGLQDLVSEFPKHALSVGSRKEYDQAFDRFRAFCDEVGVVPHGTASVHIYAAALGLEEEKQWSTICKYLSAIKWHLDRSDHPLPASAISEKTLRGLQAQVQRPPEKAATFLPGHLKTWVDSAAFMRSSPFVQHRDLAIALVMIFGFLRASDARLLRHCDVVEAAGRGAPRAGLTLKIRKDKTNQARRGRGASASDEGRFGTRYVTLSDMPALGVLDPTRALRRYFLHFPEQTRTSERPLFASAGGAGDVLSYCYINALPKRIAGIAGLDAGEYSSHSFRRTGPTWAALGGADKRTLETHGRWSHGGTTAEEYVDAAAEMSGRVCDHMLGYINSYLSAVRL